MAKYFSMMAETNFYGVKKLIENCKLLKNNNGGKEFSFFYWNALSKKN